MSHFIESQSTRLCAAVDKYAQKQGFIAKGESVAVQVYNQDAADRKYHRVQYRVLTFSTDGNSDGHWARAKISDDPNAGLLAGLVIFPCGQQLDQLVKHVAKCVVHELFDPR